MRLGSEEWEPVSSRIVTAKLRTKGGRSPQYLFLVSVYAPNFRASDEEKEDFFSDLREVLDAIPAHSTLAVVGDWNARVGSYEGDGQWSSVLGKHGLGKANQAGLELLSFCAQNNVAIMNTEERDPQAVLAAPRHRGTTCS